MRRLCLTLLLGLAACASAPPEQTRPTATTPLPSAPAPLAASGCRADSGTSDEQTRLLGQINEVRAAQGLGRLGFNPALAQAALDHACAQGRVNAISHIGADGSRPGMRAQRAGYNYLMVAENLGLGFHSAEQAMFYWMRSPGHKKNILAPAVQDAALGLTVSRSGQRVWVLMLGRHR